MAGIELHLASLYSFYFLAFTSLNFFFFFFSLINFIKVHSIIYNEDLSWFCIWILNLIGSMTLPTFLLFYNRDICWWRKCYPFYSGRRPGNWNRKFFRPHHCELITFSSFRQSMPKMWWSIKAWWSHLFLYGLFPFWRRTLHLWV